MAMIWEFLFTIVAVIATVACITAGLVQWAWKGPVRGWFIGAGLCALLAAGGVWGMFR